MWIRFGVVWAAVCLGSAAAAGQSLTPPANDDCLACHGDASAKRDDGRSIAVDAKAFDLSIHGPVACVDCHADVKEVPHADRLAKVTCGSCHEEIASK